MHPDAAWVPLLSELAHAAPGAGCTEQLAADQLQIDLGASQRDWITHVAETIPRAFT